MVEGPLIIILQMVQMLIGNIISTLFGLVSLLGSLFGQLGFVSTFGSVGFLAAGVVGMLVVFFLGRLIIGMGKSLLMLMMVCVVLFLLIFFGLGL